jgi:cytochrome c-type biogenesis protein CcmH
VSLFIAAAALMVIGALAVLVWPLVRGPDARSIKSAVATVVLLPVVSGALYALWTTWRWDAPPPAQSGAPPEVMAMVERLATRLAREGGSLEDWQMLGGSWVQLQQYDLAAEAYRQAYRLSGGNDVETLTSYAEALTLADPDALLADAGDLFERALTLAPDDGKSLWYGGLAAFGREDYAVARDRWQALIDRDPPPPEDVRQVLAERVALAEERLQAAGGGTPASPPASAAGLPPAAPGAALLRVEVSVAPAVAAQVPDSATLFVLARTPGAAGPPLAVERRMASELPLTVELSDADAMLPGRTLSGAREVEVVARISASGQPIAQPGDLYGAAQASAGDGVPVRVQIDRVQP